MPVAIDSFLLMTTTELSDLRTKVVAELGHQVKGGASWSRQGSHQKTGIQFSDLAETLKAIDFAIAHKNGTIATETIADLSGDAV